MFKMKGLSIILPVYNEEKILEKNTIKLEKFLKTLIEESKVEVPYYYLSSDFKKEKKIDEMIKELKKKGFKASRTHFEGKGIRTNFNVY